MIALSGLLLVLFLGAHLAGVALALVDPAAFEAYAATLHRQEWLPLAEGGLAAAALTHPLLSLHRSLANRRARGPVAGPMRSRRQGPAGGVAAMAAGAIPWTGTLLLGFLVVHLAQLRGQRPPAGQELEAVMTALSSPWSLALYVLAGGAVALHLFHGNESAHRSLGFLDATNGPRIRRLGRALALMLGGGFAIVPLALRLS